MFGWIRKRDAPAPLHGWLKERNLNWFEAIAQEQISGANDAQKLLRMLAFTGVVACAGSFVERAGPSISKAVGDVGLDAVDFEVLAFTFYAVRESHLPTPDDPLDDSDPEELVDAYRLAMSTIPHLVEKETGWQIEATWERRILSYFQQSNIRDAAESLVGTLLTMKGVQKPTLNYGPLSLDLGLNLKMRALIHTYASEIPKGVAARLQELAVDHGLIS